MKKPLRIILIAFPLVVVAVAALLLWRLDAIVRSTVQTQATAQLGVPATLDSARVGVLSGVVALNDFALSSPSGFSAERMFELGEVNVSTGYRDLVGQPIRVRSVVIDRPRLVIEQKDLKLNVKALIDGMPQSPSAPADGRQTIRLIVDELMINGASVVIHPGIPGIDQQMDLTIPPIAVRNIGTADGAENGAAIREVVLIVIDALTDAASRSDKVPAEVRQLLSLDIEALARERIEGVQQEIGRAIEGVLTDPTRAQDVGRQLERGLRDAIGGKKDPKKD